MGVQQGCKDNATTCSLSNHHSSKQQALFSILEYYFCWLKLGKPLDRMYQARIEPSDTPLRYPTVNVQHLQPIITHQNSKTPVNHELNYQTHLGAPPRFGDHKETTYQIYDLHRAPPRCLTLIPPIRASLSATRQDHGIIQGCHGNLLDQGIVQAQERGGLNPNEWHV